MRKVFWLMGLLALVCSYNLEGKKNNSLSDAERKRKADYIYLESQSKSGLEDIGSAFNLLRRTYDLDSTDISVGKELGFNMILIALHDPSRIDSTLLDRGFEMMKKSFENNFDDYYSSKLYASVCQRLGKEEESLKVWAILDSIYPFKPEIAVNHAEMLLLKGDTLSVKQAIEIYDRLETAQGKNLLLVNQKIHAYMMRLDTLAVVSELRKLTEDSPGSSTNQIFSGDIYMALNLPDSALYHYDRAVELDSTNGLAYHRLAEYYQAIGDSAAYDREVFNALSQGNLEISDKLELMRSYVQNLYTDTLQRPRIEKLFTIMTELHPIEPQLRQLYSIYLAIIGEYQQSAEQTEIAVGLNPSELSDWSRLISLYLQLSEYDKAIDAGQNSLHYFPEDVSLHMLTATAFQLTDSLSEALLLIDKALEIADPYDREILSEIQTTKGDVFYKMNMSDSAFVYYDLALKNNPMNLMAMNNCAYFLACENRELDKAYELSNKVITEEPENATYLDTFAWVLFKQKKFEEAKNYIDKTLELEEKHSAELFEHAGDIYFMNLLPAKAIDFWEKAFELDPTNKLLERKIKEKTYLTQ